MNHDKVDRKRATTSTTTSRAKVHGDMYAVSCSVLLTTKTTAQRRVVAQWSRARITRSISPVYSVMLSVYMRVPGDGGSLDVSHRGGLRSMGQGWWGLSQFCRQADWLLDGRKIVSGFQIVTLARDVVNVNIGWGGWADFQLPRSTYFFCALTHKTHTYARACAGERVRVHSHHNISCAMAWQHYHGISIFYPSVRSKACCAHVASTGLLVCSLLMCVRVRVCCGFQNRMGNLWRLGWLC